MIGRVVALDSRRRALLGMALLLVVASAGGAQRVDSARVTPRTPVVDSTATSVPQPPLSPRRAFLYGLALPGYAQARLGRPTAGALFVLSESIALAMLRESNAELRQARRFRQDSLVYFGVDPDGKPVFRPPVYTQSLIDVRRGHREDWVAYLIANHLFSGADAYVAAHLWDLPSQVSLRAAPDGTSLSARFTW